VCQQVGKQPPHGGIDGLLTGRERAIEIKRNYLLHREHFACIGKS
jgi:hypothetical protein